MSRWFRHYAGMMRDDKLVRVAIRSKQSIERVVWVWGAILESAAEIDDGGRYDLDAAEVAYFLRADQCDVDAILDALSGSGRVASDRVVKWSNRQFQSDRSKDRVAAHRERKRSQVADGNDVLETGNGDVTLQEQARNAPETETELETEETPQPPAGGRRGKACIPDDWTLPAISDLPPKARACAEQWTRASYETHGEAFVSFWRSERRMKADWRGTWANRVIALHSQVLRDQKFGNAPTDVAPKAPAKPMTAAEMQNAIRFHRATGNEDRAGQLEAELADRTRKVVPIGQLANDLLRRAG